MVQVHLATETWVLAHLHDKLVDGLAGMVAAREAEVKSMLAKLDKVRCVWYSDLWGFFLARLQLWLVV